MNQVFVLTFWQKVGRGNVPYLPPLQIGESWSDVTGTPAANLIGESSGVVVEVTCGDETLDVLEADEQLIVLSAEVIDGETQSSAQ